MTPRLLPRTDLRVHTITLMAGWSHWCKSSAPAARAAAAKDARGHECRGTHLAAQHHHLASHALDRSARAWHAYLYAPGGEGLWLSELGQTGQHRGAGDRKPPVRCRLEQTTALPHLHQLHQRTKCTASRRNSWTDQDACIRATHGYRPRSHHTRSGMLRRINGTEPDRVAHQTAAARIQRLRRGEARVCADVAAATHVQGLHTTRPAQVQTSAPARRVSPPAQPEARSTAAIGAMCTRAAGRPACREGGHSAPPPPMWTQ